MRTLEAREARVLGDSIQKQNGKEGVSLPGQVKHTDRLITDLDRAKFTKQQGSFHHARHSCSNHIKNREKVEVFKLTAMMYLSDKGRS